MLSYDTSVGLWVQLLFLAVFQDWPLKSFESLFFQTSSLGSAQDGPRTRVCVCVLLL